MGWSSQVVVARQVLIAGAAGGLFVYDTTGRLIVSATGANVPDPEDGQQCAEGVELHGAGAFSLTTEDAGEADPGLIRSQVTSNLPSRQLVTEITSPRATGQNSAILQLFSESANGSLAAVATLNAQLSVQGLGAALFMQKAATPPTPVTGGILYVNTTGDLHYLGPAGTNTKLASA